MKTRTVFIFAYYSYLDPVFQSAVLPYFVNFPERDKYRFILLNFEQPAHRMTDEERARIRTDLAAENIHWYNSVWRSGRFKMIKKLIDLSVGLLISSYLIIRYRPAVIYSEAFPGAIISHFLSRIYRIPHVVHTFEPHADYMVEAGVWNDQSWEVKLLRSMEARVARGASAIMTATQAMIDRIAGWGVDKTKIHRVPSCVDGGFFAPDAVARKQVREKLGVSDDQIVLGYLGKFDGYYWKHELFEFFAVCHRLYPGRFRFLIMTPEDIDEVRGYSDSFAIDPADLDVVCLNRDQVPGHLNACDIGLSAVRNYPSKRFCSPIKNGEYWACGLPILTLRGVSDDFEFAEQEEIGIVIDEVNEVEVQRAAEQILDWFDSGKLPLISQSAREFALRDRSVQKYQELFATVFESFSKT